jgi:Domain of unknown function (DUF6249)
MVPVPIMLDVPATPDTIPGEAIPLFGVLAMIIAIVFGIGVVMLRLYLDFRRKRELYQLYHAERMAAIEKGIEVPPLPADFFRDTRAREPAPSRSRRWGLVLLFLGITLAGGLWGSGTGTVALWGLVPAGLGLGLALASRFEAKEKAGTLSATDVNRDRGPPGPPSS